ncbi:MAG: hypothetical protein IJ391_02725 [Clostridia bacterium]|nr:hypothetical protein [Clostridia bacterium]
MISADKVLERVNALRPNSFGSYLEHYLESFELKVKKDLLFEADPVYNASALVLDAPDDIVYDLYLFTVIDFLNGEFGRYENTYSAFISAWEMLLSSSAEEEDTEDSITNNNGGAMIKLW